MRLEAARILVVDDHADLVENLQEILGDEGADVVTASSAAEAVRAAQDGFDVALVDVRLPDARGPKLIPELKGPDGLHEVLLVTGHASLQDAVEAVKAGAFAYVLKPFDSEELVVTVGRAVERVRLRRQAKALQRAIEQREAELSTLVDTVQALLLVLDQDCVVVQANPAVASATGLGLDHIIGRCWTEHFVPPREQVQVREICHSLNERSAGASLETSVLRRGPKGNVVEERRVSWRLSALQVAPDQSRIYASGLDVTDIRSLEQRTRLAEKLAAVGTISAGLAHEIRNPLNAAALQLQLLSRRLAKLGSDPKLEEPIEMVQHEITRLGHLVSDFLSFARPQALNLARTDLSALGRRVAALLRPLAEERAVELRCNESRESVFVEADAQRLEQVLLNLVRNGMDAVDSGGCVDLQVEPDGAGARITISDDGPGVPEELQARIFEPFFTTKESGTGLGMAIAHTIVEMHGGQIQLTNAPGATFTISLPRRPPMPL